MTQEEVLGLLPEALAVAVIVGCAVYLLRRLLATVRAYADDASEAVIREQIGRLRSPLVLAALCATVAITGSATDRDWGGAAVTQIATAGFIAAGAWMLMRIGFIVQNVIMTDYDLTASDNLHSRKMATQLQLLRRIANAIVIVLAGAMILMSFDGVRRIGISLLASAGLAGIVIGLAAQKMLAGILAGFQLAIAQPIRIDDVVIVEGEWGRIEEITLTYVVVRIWDKRRLVVPSSWFLDKPFQNWTRVSADVLGTVFLYTDYTLDVDALRTALQDILKDCEYWDGEVGNVQVTNATDRTMEVRALVSAKDSGSAWNLRVHVREKLIAWMQQHHPEKLPRTRILLEPESQSATHPAT